MPPDLKKSYESFVFNMCITSKIYKPENGSQEYTNVSDVNRNVEKIEKPMNCSRGHHKAWVYLDKK